MKNKKNKKPYTKKKKENVEITVEETEKPPLEVEKSSDNGMISSSESDTGEPAVHDYESITYYKQMLESPSVIGEDQDSITRLCQSVPLVKCRPMMINLAEQFSDSEIFLIDGDALLVSGLMNKNVNWTFGGQMLHFIYVIERQLNVLVQKGGKYHVIFFKENEIILWRNSPSVLLARKVLMLHLKFNMSIKVLRLFHNVWDNRFADYIINKKPIFMLMNDEGLEGIQIEKLIGKEAMALSQYCFQWQINKVLALKLNVALLEGMQLGVSTLKGFFIETNGKLCNIYDKNEKTIKRKYQSVISQLKISEKNKVKSVQMLPFPDLNIECSSLHIFLNQQEGSSKDFAVFSDFGKIFLLYILIKQEFPLKKRSFPLLSSDMETEKLFAKMQLILYNFLCTKEDEQHLDLSHISDIWDGNMLATICRLVVNNKSSIAELLTNRMYKIYKQIFDQIYCKLEDNDCIQIGLELEVLLRGLREEEEHLFVSKPIIPEIIPVQSELLENYAGEVYSSINKLPEDSPRIQELLPEFNRFEDKYHWHCKIVLSTDTFKESQTLRLGSNHNADDPSADEFPNYYKKEKHERYERKKQQRNENKLPRFIKFYGDSMGVKSQNIVLENRPKFKESKLKENKGSAKAQSIRDENLKDKLQKDEEKDMESLKNARKEAKLIKSSLDEDKYIKFLNNLDKIKVQSESVKREIIMMKISCLKPIIVKKGKDESLVELFLLLRELWIELQEQLTDEDKTELATVLKELKFFRLSSIFDSTITLNIENSKCHLEFQMKCMGHLLLRDIRKDPDKRIDPKSYIPDTWQRKLLDSVDGNRSALIVAPTSSGKTFASYYCMEKILKQSNEDVVVYVSPTKALCNQVMAMVCNRYNKNMPPGKTVCGVFTRDFRDNVSNCQILVTVPQCLEVLLLSKDGYDWTRRIKYVIFDEIHCIGSEMGALVWEHLLLLISCPFLALSATVENPDELHKWLQSAQDFQRMNKGKISNSRKSDEAYNVDLVIVTDRYSHLKKHVYRSSLNTVDSVQPLHPCAVLTASAVKFNGIPNHISLAPEECMELFHAMKETWPDKEDLLSLSPETFFDKNLLFMTMSDIKKYESALKEELSKWACRNKRKFRKCVASLLPTPPHQGRRMGNKELANFVQLLNALKAKDMLPVIVFCLDRQKCCRLVDEVCRYCRRAEMLSQQEKTDKNSKANQNRMKKYQLREHSSEKCSEVNNSIVKEKPSLVWLAEQKSGVSFRGVGVQDSDDLDFLYRRLNHNPLFMQGIRYGISYHHSGMNNKMRSTVEILFRRKFIRVVVATSTLALGIHAPCRSVILYDDSPYLTPIMYRQMAGRAGRRGFDMIGNVIFQNISDPKVCRLMSGSLPRILGNFPISITLYLRLYLLVDGVTDCGKPSKTAREDTVIRATSLLMHPLILQQNPELNAQFQHLYLFSTQFLMREGLLNRSGQPQGLAGIAAHLHYHEPGNYAFISALTAGLFHHLCTKKNAKSKGGKFCEVFLRQLVTILSYYFTKLPVHQSHKEACELNNSVVALPPLLEEFQKDIEDYNERVSSVFDMYLVSVALHCDRTLGEDNVLPLSKVAFKSSEGFESPEHGTVEYLLSELSHDNKICSNFVGLSSHTDNHLYKPGQLVSNARQGVFTDVKIIPTMDYRDDLNSYALDFFKHGIEDAIINENNLKSGEAYTKIYDFSLVLLAITVPLEEFSPPGDPVAAAFRQLADEYAQRFREAFQGNSY